VSGILRNRPPAASVPGKGEDKEVISGE